MADFGLVHAAVGDTQGELPFGKTALNVHPLAAMAGCIAIAEVETLVEPDELSPVAVHPPGGLVRGWCTWARRERIEERTVSA